MDGEITAAELKTLLDTDEDVRLVDIRNRTAFERGHIPSSDNIPFEELPQRVEELDDDDHIVTICPLGKSSIQAARLIESYEGTNDTTIESLADGLQGWEYALESNNGNAETNDGTKAPF
ncbi:rhodanese-like domain-containing protein [Halocatena marina]|uniref:Rhodanese-like domain-containing protein n=1 Tax=Halocatena marina TaxID=2934937 RepID=A0ABD5YGG9_9EURY|nr:rhodanese-like domain-containing protein [Halocatena marina]